MAHDALGRSAAADALLAQAEPTVMSWQYQIAQIYAHRRDRERAFLWLERANRARDRSCACRLNHPQALPQPPQ
jgi:TPR repeat protein